MHEVAKASANKKSVGGFKVAGRVRDERGHAAQELIVSAASWEDGQKYVERSGSSSSSAASHLGGKINLSLLVRMRCQRLLPSY